VIARPDPELGGANTMFPKDWDDVKIQTEIKSAWESRAPHPDGNPDMCDGMSSSGVLINGYLLPKATAYPVIKKSK
jgi:hypothetical protein